ncbi:MAG TPA: 2-phosphosulfolactate phosphatase [Anseongella sp.]
MVRRLEVCFTPALLPLYEIDDSIVVIIDIFRASSSICYGIDNGASGIIPVATVEECREYGEGDFLLAAEREGQVVEGFDFGNSPFSYTAEKVSGRQIVLTTTNGTQALHQSLRANKIVVGSFLNISALCNWLHQQQQSVLLLCAGWKGMFNLEDTLFAGAVVNRLRQDITNVDDAGIAAEELFLMAGGNLREFLRKSSHSIRLEKLNIEEDICFCLQSDICNSIPVLENDCLRKMTGEQAEPVRQSG